MNPLVELRAMLSEGSGTYSGKVVALEEGAASVETVAGRIRATRSTTLVLSVGDEVLVRDGNIQGRLRAKALAPVYRL